ncbi:MAG: DNA polymerase IV [Bacteroidota bacterium]|nr:DNA polymerase IV [Bacteroidota bacterium]
MQQTYIAHIDLDCFFVSVERIKNPALIGKPVAVGGSPTDRGVIASASYEARKFGVRSAMPTSQALKLCPNLIVVSGHHIDYSDYSNRLYHRMLEFSPIVERASIDEMYLDFTGCEKLYKHDLPGFIKILQQLISTEFQLPSTIALASNKLVAKIAANTVKPEGVIYIPHGTESKFLAPLPIEVIPGVGKKTEEFLKQKGFLTVADIQSVAREKLVETLGANGDWIYNASFGRGSTTLETSHIPKSISREETFTTDVSETEELKKILFSLVESVCTTLRSHNFKARTVTLKLRNPKFTTSTHRQTIAPTNYDPVVFKTASELLKKNYDDKTPIRLIGIGLSNFVDAAQTELELFQTKEKKDKIVEAVDKIRDKFGDDAIRIGNI